MKAAITAVALAVVFAAAGPPVGEGPESASAAETAGDLARIDDAPDGGSRFETTVIGQRALDVRRVAGSAHALRSEDLERHEYDDVHRILQQVPGVYVRDEDGYGLRPNVGLRGAASDRSSKIALMEDGILFAPAPYSAPAAYYFPLVTRMEAVEIYKGPASIRFGPNTIGGAIDMRTRGIPYQQGAAGIDIAAGSYRAGKVHGYAGYGGDWFGVLLEGVHLQSGGFKQLDGGGNTGFDKDEAMAKLRLGREGGRAGQFEIKLGYADEGSNETYLGLSDAEFRAHPLRRYAASQRDRMEWTRTQTQVSHVLERGTFGLRTTLYRHDFHRAWTKLNRFASGPALIDVLAYPESGQSAVLAAILAGREDSQGAEQTLLVGTNDRRFVSQGVQLTGRWQSEKGFVDQVLELGVRLHHDEIERLHDESGFSMERGVLVPDGRPAVVTTSNNGFTRALALHVQDEVTLGRLLLVPGARLELIDARFVDRQDGNTQRNVSAVPLVGLGAVWEPTRHVSLVGGVHQGFSPVSPGQPPEVLPERSVNYELGTRFRSRSTRAELIGFFNDYFNLTGECTLSAGCPEELLNRQFNGGAVNVFGLEAAVAHRQPAPLGLRVDIELTYTLTLSEFLTSFESDAPQFGSVEAGDSLPYVPMHEGALRIRLSGESWAVAAAASYVSEMRERAGQGRPPPMERTDPRLVIDLAVHRSLGDSSELYATATNLLDARYVAARRPYGARPGAPLQFQAGFKHRFH
jgi:Fe(3+) dicitrate transport protein